MKDFMRNYIREVAEANFYKVDELVINGVICDMDCDDRLWNQLDEYILEHLEPNGAEKEQEEICWEDILRDREMEDNDEN